MNEPSNVIRGTLHPDGTLELVERPTLPAGPVEVIIRPVMTERKGENWFDYLQRTRAELEASGAVFRTKEEIDADIEEMRDWDSRLDEIRRSTEGYGLYLQSCDDPFQGISRNDEKCRETDLG